MSDAVDFSMTWASGGEDAIIARADADRVAIGSDPLEPGQHMSLETAEHLARWILGIRAKAEKAGALRSGG